MRRARIAGLLAIVAVSLVLGLGAGTVPLGPGDVWRGLWSADAPASVIVRELRLPRVLLAFLVGGSLAVCGAALQAMIRNPLAEPYLLGLSGGAGLGAVLALASRTAGPWAVPVAAFAGALAAVGLVYRLSLVAGRRLDPRILLLSGVVVGAFAGALMSAIICSPTHPPCATPSSGCSAGSARPRGRRSRCSPLTPSYPWRRSD